jgi:aminobenzoyl-glutamate utilization protein B
LERKGLPGRVRYYGCPAEEAAAGKSFMVREGAFADVDAAVTWHPFSSLWTGQWLSLAYTQVYFHFTGVAAHAGMSPEMGRSALDAVELMNVGVNFLREHMASTSRVHYAITDAGGVSPNVVQSQASVYYCVRALTLPEMRDLYERVVKIAQGAALMTGTELRIEFDGACAEYIPNDVLESILHRNVEAMGPVPFDIDDQATARKYLALNMEGEIDLCRERSGIAPGDDRGLHADPPPLNRVQLTGSTDVGDVSWVTPTVSLMGPCLAIGTTPHTWQWVAQGKLPAAHKGMVYSAKAIAATAVELFVEPALLAQAREEFTERAKRHPYVSPIPDDVVAPPLREGAGESAKERDFVS